MTGKRIGYKRVSTSEQNPDSQLIGIELDKVFVEIETGGAREVESVSAVEGDQFLVESLGSAAGGQAEHDVRLRANGAGDDARGFTADFRVVFFQDNEHAERVSFFAKRSASRRPASSTSGSASAPEPSSSSPGPTKFQPSAAKCSWA